MLQRDGKGKKKTPKQVFIEHCVRDGTHNKTNKIFLRIFKNDCDESFMNNL